jgi:hypothetical protein
MEISMSSSLNSLERAVCFCPLVSGGFWVTDAIRIAQGALVHNKEISGPIFLGHYYLGKYILASPLAMGSDSCPMKKRWMTVATVVLGTGSLLLLLFLGGGILLPGTWSAQASLEIDAEASSIFPYLSTPSFWEEWTPPLGEGVELIGPRSGEGAGRSWSDPVYGSGSFLIERSEEPARVEYRVEVEGGAIVILGVLELLRQDDGTRVRWREDGDFGWNPLLRYAARGMAESQSQQLAESLARLRALVEGSGPS